VVTSKRKKRVWRMQLKEAGEYEKRQFGEFKEYEDREFGE